MTIIGTNHFFSLRDARNYYGYSEEEINQKVRAGEICIGKPVLKEGEKLLIKKEKPSPYLSRRYVIEC